MSEPNQIKKKYLAPEVIDYFDNQIDAEKARIDQEILDRIAGDAASVQSANAYTDTKIAQIPSVDLSNYYNKSEVDSKDLELSVRIAALEQYDQESVFVDAVNGVDEPGRGTMLRPFKTINYAYSQVPSLGNPSNTSYNANVGKFITEKLVFRLAPGTYNENVVLGFKRARVALLGNGVTITGDVRMEAKMADFPASSLRGSTMAASFPAPWTGWTSGVQQCFEIAGEAGGGLESDPTSNTVQITGLTSLVFAEASMTGPQWDSAFGTFFCNVRSASLNRGVVAATQHSAATPSMTEVLFEIDSARIGSELSVRNYFGGVPHGYIANYATWSSANNGTTNKAPTGAVTVKMHNSTMASVLGPRLTIGEMDGCRVYDIDRTMGGTVDNGAIGGSASSSYVGIVNTQFRAYSGTNALQLGASSGTSRLKIDSVSYTTLAFSRNSSGVLSARSLVLGGTVFDFLDDARSIFVNDPATNYSRTDSSVNAALEGIDAALGLKANQSSISAIESNVSSLQSGLAQEILDRQAGDVSSLNAAKAHADAAVLVEKNRAEGIEAGLQSAINTEKGRIDAILSASQADKDSFAEIVALINSVDLENDNALAYVVASLQGADAALDGRLDTAEGEIDALQSGLAQELIDRAAGDSALDARIVALETAPPGMIAHKMSAITVSASELSYIDCEHQAKPMSLHVFVGRLAVHEGVDYTVSVVGGKTRITWAGSLVNPSGVESIELGDRVYISYMR
jgi:hypothetical protein